MRKATGVLLPAMGLLLLLVLWQVGVQALALSPAILPPPLLALRSLQANAGLLLSEGWVTLRESLYGFLLAFAIGVPIAVGIVSSRLLDRMFYPLLIMTQSLPKVALAPIVLVWLGTGMQSKVAIAALVAFFPIVVDTAAGLRGTPAELLELARATRASQFQTFRKIRFPAALPFILAGSKVAITLAVIGAVIGEFVGSDDGLGNLLLVANSQLNTPLAFAALTALAILGMALYAAVAGIEFLLRPWLGEARHG
jgi:NitT/TauT family transport system permease protein